MNQDFWANRIKKLPPYLFAEIDETKAVLRSEGVDIIDLSIGDPDLPTPEPIIKSLQEAVNNANNHRYPSYVGSQKFREAVSSWYQDRFDVKLNPKTEVMALIGSKEGIAHAPLAFVNPGELSLIPDIGYPVYANATTFAGGEYYQYPLREEQNYFPQLGDIPADVRKKAKLLFFNYPHNPTSAVATQKGFEDITTFCREHHILACHDGAYTEVCFGGNEPLSYMQASGALDAGIEFHSLSKTFNMTGWRIAFVCWKR